MIDARNNISHWKTHRCVDDVFGSELAFRLIYDNIRPKKIADALTTMGLSRLPNLFF